MPKVNYRKLAFEAYPQKRCVLCGFGIHELLEVAHIDTDRANNDKSNLVLLCPTCHKMLDVGLISVEAIVEMRDSAREISWSKRMKDAGAKAALTRRRRQAARKAVATRLANRNETKQ